MAKPTPKPGERAVSLGPTLEPGVLDTLGTWTQLAMKVKKDGNALFMAQQYHAAIICYSGGIDQWTDTVIRNPTWWHRASHHGTSTFFDTLAQLLNNRAACHMMLCNMKAVLKDTAAAMHLCNILRLVHEPALPHHMTCLRNSSGCVGTYCKAQVRRARALEAMGNTAAVTPMLNDAMHSDEYGNLPSDVQHDYMTSTQRCHPCPGHARRKLDWSLITVGKWSKRSAGGTLPVPVHSFAAAHHNGHVYIVGGEGSLATGLSGNMDATYALQLSTMTWRRVTARGSSSPLDRLPPDESIHVGSTAVWRTSICVLVPQNQSLHLFDMHTETWSRRKAPNAIKGVTSPWGGSAKGCYSSFAMAVWRDTLYIHGGQNRVNAKSTDRGMLLAYDLVKSVWKVLHYNERLSYDYPEARHAHQMWVLDGKLYIFGGRTPAEENFSVDDRMIDSSSYFWSYDLATAAWRNESCFMNGGNFTNMPASRTEFAAATFGGDKALVYGGYATNIGYHVRGQLTMHNFSYLSDTFTWEAKTNTWKLVHVEQWPDYRAGAALVFIPDPHHSLSGAVGHTSGSGADSSGSSSGVAERVHSTPNGAGAAAGGETQGCPSMDDGGSSSSVAGGGGGRRKQTGGRLLMLGGYFGGGLCAGSPFDEVWELTLGHSMKHVATECWGCGQVSASLKQCGGTCGGAVMICGRECQAKVWKDHRHWCSRVAG